jgi:3-oxoacyl-[acyl-carrier protein] reductase
MSDQARKVTIITGASRGIGAAMAERLAQDGFAVVVKLLRSGSAGGRAG